MFVEFKVVLREELRHQQRKLVAQIRGTRLPIRVALVPLVKGDSWNGDPQQLASVVHDRMGGGPATLEQCEASIEAGLPALRLEMGADRQSVALLEQQLQKSKAVLPRRRLFVG